MPIHVIRNMSSLAISNGKGCNQKAHTGIASKRRTIAAEACRPSAGTGAGLQAPEKGQWRRVRGPNYTVISYETACYTPYIPSFIPR